MTDAPATIAPYERLIWIDNDERYPTSADRENHRESGLVDMDIKNPTSGARAYLESRLSTVSSSEPDRQKGAAFGLLPVSAWGASTTQDNTALFAEIVTESATTGRQIMLDGGKVYPGTMKFQNQPVRMYHGNTGFIGHMKGAYAVEIDNRLGAEAAIADIRGVHLPTSDTGNPDDAHHEITLSRADMAANNPQRGDAFWLYGDNYFLDPTRDTVVGGATVLGAANFNGEGLRTYVGQWVTALGVGIDLVDVAGSGGVRQGDFVAGATSGATGWVQSSVVNSEGVRVAILAGVVAGTGTGKGYFIAGESLTVAGVAKGTITARAPYIVTEEPLVFELSLNPRLAKGRMDVEVDLTGLRTVAFGGDIDAFVGKANRKSAIRTTAVVLGTGYAYVKSSWKHGVESAIGYKWTDAGVRMDKGPAHAEDVEGAWSYAWEDLGGASKSSLRIWAHNVRHGYSTNTRPKNGPLNSATDYDYITTAGVAHDIRVHDSTLIGCLDAALDTHAGSVRITFESNYIDGGGGGGRTQARAAGIQSRGFGNIIRNNTIKNVVDGIREVSSQFPAPFDMKVRIEDNSMIGVMGTAYNLMSGGVKGSEAKGKTRVYIDDKSVTLGTISSTNNMPASPNSPTFMRMDIGWLEWRDPKLYGLRANSPGYFGVEGQSITPDHVEIVGGKVDYTEATATVRGWQIQSLNAIPYFGIVRNDVTGNPTSVVRNGAKDQNIYTNDLSDLDSGSTLPFVTNFTPANQLGTSNDTNPATANAAVAPQVGNVLIIATKETGGVLNFQWTPATAPGTIAAGKSWSVLMPAVGALQGDYGKAAWIGTLPAGVRMDNPTINTDSATIFLTNTTDVAVTMNTVQPIRLRLER